MYLETSVAKRALVITRLLRIHGIKMMEISILKMNHLEGFKFFSEMASISCSTGQAGGGEIQPTGRTKSWGWAPGDQGFWILLCF